MVEPGPCPGCGWDAAAAPPPELPHPGPNGALDVSAKLTARALRGAGVVIAATAASGGVMALSAHASFGVRRMIGYAILLALFAAGSMFTILATSCPACGYGDRRVVASERCPQCGARLRKPS